MEPRHCLICDAPLSTHKADGVPYRLHRRYCSPKCARRAQTKNRYARMLRAQGLAPHVQRSCRGCGADLPYAGNRLRDYCGPHCRGKRHEQRKHDDQGSERLDLSAERITRCIEAWTVYLRKARVFRLEPWQCPLGNRYEPD